ncbi:hypothetical protein GCM10029964_068480 [Kibdelosporangium lantanae]
MTGARAVRGHLASAGSSARRWGMRRLTLVRGSEVWPVQLVGKFARAMLPREDRLVRAWRATDEPPTGSSVTVTNDQSVRMALSHGLVWDWGTLRGS